jgi:hypothetical protein
MILALALMILLLLTSLMLALVTLGQSEPAIAANHYRNARARALAESGIERALWASSNPGAPGGLSELLEGPAPPPYSGATHLPLVPGAPASGEILLTVTGAAPLERSVDSVGWHARTGHLGRGRARALATLVKLRIAGLSPPATMTVRGQLQVADTATVDARADTSCGPKLASASGGPTTIGGAAAVFGSDGNATSNQGGSDYRQGQPPPSFEPVGLSGPDLQALKAYARARGTYYRGAIDFSPSNPLPDGLVFVDTASGNPIPEDTAAQDPADLATVTITGPAHGPAGFRGVLIVNGTLAIAGDGFVAEGLVHLRDAVTISGAARVTGAVVSWNVRTGTSAIAGAAALAFDCAAARGAGAIPQGWFVKPGSYHEVSGE